jgi:hypothetical protein
LVSYLHSTPLYYSYLVDFINEESLTSEVMRVICSCELPLLYFVIYSIYSSNCYNTMFIKKIQENVQNKKYVL